MFLNFFADFIDMTKLKMAFKSFLLLLSVFIGFRAMALNPMCHSPIQVAALMSPNKPKISSNQTKIRQLEKKIEKHENSMSEAEDLLAESLNQEKLGESPYNVASSIRDYIEDFQDGWPCADSSSQLLFKGFFYSHWNFLNAMLPFAYADLARECAEDGGFWNRETEKCQGGGTAKSGEEPAQNENNTPDSEGSSEKATETTRKVTTCPEDQKVNGECVTNNFDGAAEKLNCQTNLGWTWENSQCICPAPKIIVGNKCQIQETGKVKTCPEGQKVVDGKCVPVGTFDGAAEKLNCQTNLGWTWENSQCICPAPKTIVGNKCRKKTPLEECNERPGSWTWEDPECFCPAPKIIVGNKCRIQETGKVKTCPEGQKVVDGKCVPVGTFDGAAEKLEAEVIEITKDDSKEIEEPSDCPNWKKDPNFKNNGKVDGRFCDNFAKNKKQCKEALSKMQRLAKVLKKYQNRLEKAEESSEQEDSSQTEAGGLCFECLKREIKANQASSAQNIGGFLNLLTGAGMTYLGYRTGQTAQTDTNMLRIQQGYPVQQNYFALNGASAGFPYLSNGIYGLTRTNTPTGGWVCSPSVSPYGGAYNYGMNYGYSVPYM